MNLTYNVSVSQGTPSKRGRKEASKKKKTEKKVTEIQEQKDDKLENLVIKGKKEVNRADNLMLFNTFFFSSARQHVLLFRAVAVLRTVTRARGHLQAERYVRNRSS